MGNQLVLQHVPRTRTGGGKLGGQGFLVLAHQVGVFVGHMVKLVGIIADAMGFGQFGKVLRFA
jgi:hypothetical protein